jgi:hypothetical protein
MYGGKQSLWRSMFEKHPYHLRIGEFVFSQKEIGQLVFNMAQNCESQGFEI